MGNNTTTTTTKTKLETQLKESSTVRINNELKRKLAKISGKITLQNGEITTMEKVIEELLKVYEKHEGDIDKLT
jgi:predicted transcriptional regulator